MGKITVVAVLNVNSSVVRLVWVVKEVFRTVEVYELARQPQLRTIDDDLLGDPVIPGFTLPVRTLFS